MIGMLSLLLMTKNGFNFGLVKNVCDALSYLLDNIFIRFGTELHRQIVEIPINTPLGYAPLVADMFLFCY